MRDGLSELPQNPSKSSSWLYLTHFWSLRMAFSYKKKHFLKGTGQELAGGVTAGQMQCDLGQGMGSRQRSHS